MKAVVVNNWVERIDELRVDKNAPEPKLEENQVLVEVKATALNFFDILQVQGKYQEKPPLPFIPGVEKYKVGDRIFGVGNGCFAERATVDVDSSHLIPSGMNYEEAAGLYVTYPTSYAALAFRAKLREGEWCLVHAAAGGVGIAAVQFAKALGAKVIATCGSEEKLVIAKRFGADYGINYNEKDWHKQVLKITGGHGVEVVYDPVGLIRSSIRCLGGEIEKIPANLILVKNISILGFYWGSYKRNEPERIPDVWREIFKLIAEKKVKSVVYEKIYHGLDSVKDGMNAIYRRETYGKAIVIPGSSRESKI
ncbi:1699_t:CDS:2 [Acaulospora colombiana]|uniref:1699_t:CDS:1 n=1 Tax=Acaulospora colombiana TaxID=27376 RepID=A0ACA9JV52_9GLOM|nr:1699_t:CDS:2 [Acaulospora colombiana]